MKIVQKVLAGLALLALTGCTSLEVGNAKPMDCPTVRVLEHSDKMIRFNGAKQSLDNVLFMGKIENISGECLWIDNKLKVELSIEGYLTMGQKADPKIKYKSPFYVTVTNLNKDIIQRLTIDVDNKWNGRVGTVGRTVDLEIPLKNIKYADDLVLYVGYHVTPAELAFIRAQKQ